MVVDRVREVLRDRKFRGRMSDAGYWDERVRSRHGHARGVWHAEAFSNVWNQRQVALLQGTLTELLGEIRGRRIADVGCGTGRITLELELLGAEAVGVDFSPATIDAAREESASVGSRCRFEIGDVSNPPLLFESQSFDAVVSVGCLAVACRNTQELGRALGEMGRLIRPEGAVVLLEPIHQSRLLGRILKAPVSEWVRAGERAGLRLERRHGMGLVPMRLALSSFDLPSWLVEPAFRVGERALEATRVFRLADYTLLSFRLA